MKILLAFFAAAAAAAVGAEDASSAAQPAQPAKERVVIMCAHPDDFSGISGTAMLLTEKFDVHVIDYTHGEGGLGKEGFLDGSAKKGASGMSVGQKGSSERRCYAYAKFRPNRRGYDGRAWNFRLFCATYAAARFGRSYALFVHSNLNFA